MPCARFIPEVRNLIKCMRRPRRSLSSRSANVATCTCAARARVELVGLGRQRPGGRVAWQCAPASCLPLGRTTSQSPRASQHRSTRRQRGAPTSLPSLAPPARQRLLNTRRQRGLSHASKAVTAFGAGTPSLAVPPVSDGLQAPRTLPTAADWAGGSPRKALRGLGRPPGPAVLVLH